MRSVPKEVRQWIEREVITAPSTLRLIEILHHTKLVTIEQVIESLDTINRLWRGLAAIKARKFCSLDSEGHCFVALETQASLAQALAERDC